MQIYGAQTGSGIGGSKITFERIDFTAGTATGHEREIDSRAVLAGNALFQKLSKSAIMYLTNPA